MRKYVEKGINMPAISVIMPVYNTKEYVGKAIQSVLDQTFDDFEFLIINSMKKCILVRLHFIRLADLKDLNLMSGI